MGNLSNIGRIFYGVAMAETGLQTIYYHNFPYWLVPPNLVGIPGHAILASISGALLILAGACIILEIKTRPVSLLSGGMFLVIFCFYYIPYELIASNYLHLGDWENAEKELAFASGALIVAGCFSKTNDSILSRPLARLIPWGAIFFSIPIISFGILHLLIPELVATMVPSWIPNPLFWAYFAGVALICSGTAIILKIKTRLIATLLGVMILSWFIILHIPRVIASPVSDLGDEITSAFLALSYSGVAFVIAGAAKKS